MRIAVVDLNGKYDKLRRATAAGRCWWWCRGAEQDAYYGWAVRASASLTSPISINQQRSFHRQNNSLKRKNVERYNFMGKEALGVKNNVREMER